MKTRSDEAEVEDRAEPESSDAPSGREEDIVLVIHGTFNNQDLLKDPEWFEPDPGNEDNFCTLLNRALAQTPLGEAVWRSIPREKIFSWSGDNDHEERCLAAESLCAYLVGLVENHPTARVHLVAHSHGGNVVLKAVELYQEHLADEVPDPPQVSSPTDIGSLGQWLKRSFSASQRKKAAQEKAEMRLRQMTSHKSNRLGRIVFLGTPFFRKQWALSRFRLIRFLRGLRSYALAFPALLAAMWMVMPMFAFFYYSIPVRLWRSLSRAGDRSWPTWLDWDVSSWPKWLLVVWIAFSLLGVLIIYASESKLFNTNIYYSSRALYHRLRRRATAPTDERIPCLVISANLLDEALVGLSTEALVHALLVPRVRDFFGLSVPRSDAETVASRVRALLVGLRSRFAGPLEAGEAPAIGTEESLTLKAYQRFGVFVVALVPLLFYFIAVYWWWRPFTRFVLVPRATKLLMSVVNSATFGLTARELRRARISVSASLDMPELFDTKEWPVTTQLLDRSQPLESRSGAAHESRQRYLHLTDEEELDKKIAESAAADSLLSWKRLAQYEPKLYKDYLRSFEIEKEAQPLDEAGFGRELARIWFTLAERAKELVGAVELNHSIYYANARAISEIAGFLAGRPATETGEQN